MRARRIKHVWNEITKRSVLIMAVLLLSVAILFIWFLTTGFSQSQVFVSIGIAAISAFFAAISSIAALLQATEAQKLRENQERPYITVHFEGSNRGGLYLEIQNSGNSPAVNAIINFDPDPIDYAGRRLSEVSLFSKPISFIPQGKLYRQIIDSSARFLAEGKPTKFRVRVIYNSVTNQLFDETIDFDLAYLNQATRPGKTVEESLEDITQLIKAISEKIRPI